MNTAAPSTVPSVPELYRETWRHASGTRRHWLAATTLLIGSQSAKLAVPWLAAQAINQLQQGGGAALGRAAQWVLLVLLVYVGAWALHGPGRILERSVGIQVRRSLADALYGKLIRAPLAWHDKQHSGDLQQRAAQASRALSEFAQSQFVYVQTMISFVGPMLAVTALSGAVGGVALLGYALVSLVILRFDRALMRLAERENTAERRYGAGLLDFIGNIATVTSLRLAPSTQRLLARRLEAVFEPLRRVILLNEGKWCAVDLLSLGLTWMMVAAYVWQSSRGGGTVLLGSVFMIYQYAQQAGSVVSSLAANFQSLARVRTDVASADLIRQAPERDPATWPVAAGWRRIEVQGLVYEHGRGHGLHDVGLTLRRGERIALVGPSGAGKSTLMRVLAGLYDARGVAFRIDGAGQPGMRHLGSIATLIPQEADVFEATVRENVAFDLPQPPGAVEAALHVSAFDVVAAAMPQGLETPITERGFNLSGGQRQRLCLARGVLAAGGSSLLMLDEPTSALDPVTEAQVHERLTALFPDACIVASVHRMSLLEHFDRVVLMAAGCVLDAGSADELRQRQPIFRDMLKGQAAQAAGA